MNPETDIMAMQLLAFAAVLAVLFYVATFAVS
jgi:hypothetical protein